MNTCSTCKFFTEHLDNTGYGYCRRYPPKVPRVDYIQYKLTVTHKDEWCGEHKKS